MNKLALSFAALAFALPAAAQDAEPQGALSPNQIVEAAPPQEWVAIDAKDLLVMTLPPNPDGSLRQVVIQLMPPPFSQGWVDNIRLLARDHWWDGTSINRVQDNYVVQWGDPGYDNPESGETVQKPLPEGLKVVDESDYVATFSEEILEYIWTNNGRSTAVQEITPLLAPQTSKPVTHADPYARGFGFIHGLPIAAEFTSEYRQSGASQFSRKLFAFPEEIWPVHCYGMVGVGRNYSPDTGTGAELYTVIGHAPRHLDRNIALVGRVIEGMEHLSSLPRGKGQLGFYTDPEKRVEIQSIRLATLLVERDRPQFEYLGTESETFAKYAEARANRRDPFFIVPAGGADICNIPVPVRRVTPGE